MKGSGNDASGRESLRGCWAVVSAGINTAPARIRRWIILGPGPMVDAVRRRSSRGVKSRARVRQNAGRHRYRAARDVSTTFRSTALRDTFLRLSRSRVGSLGINTSLARMLVAAVAGLGSVLQGQAPISKTQAPGFYRMMLGDFEIIALNDGVVPQKYIVVGLDEL